MLAAVVGDALLRRTRRRGLGRQSASSQPCPFGGALYVLDPQSPTGACGPHLLLRRSTRYSSTPVEKPMHSGTQALAAPIQVHTDIGMAAAWRTARRSKADLETTIMQNVGVVNPMFSLPFMHQDVWRIDWLHAVDLGCGADFLGGVMWEAMQRMPGNNIAARAQAMWDDIQRYYTTNRVESRLHGFVATTVRPEASKAPKLRAGAAIVRHPIPYGLELVDRFL